MERGVDIVVSSTSTNRPELVVEVKLGGDLETATSQLAWYMSRTGVPLGLLIVNNTLRILKDSYEASGPDAIRVVRDLSTRGIDALTPPAERRRYSEIEFGAAVQTWLESLTDPATVAALPEPMRTSVREHLVPVIECATVSAGGPRVSRVGNG